MTYFLLISHRLMEKSAKINWFKRLLRLKKWTQIQHLVVIVNYRETTQKVDLTLSNLKNQNYDIKKLSVLLAMEDRDDTAIDRSRTLTDKYRQFFGDFDTCYHPVTAREIIGKASNESYAVKYAAEKFSRQQKDFKKIIVTVCDADSLLPENYFANLTLNFLTIKNAIYKFYWAPVLLYTNFWKLILPIRVQSILSSIMRLSILSWKDDLMPISTYSVSLWMLDEVGYWDTDIIPEDWHIWLQCFFVFGEKVSTIPIYLPITRDAVYATSLVKTFKTRYEQERRWAWGVTDIAYAIPRLFSSSNIPLKLRLKRVIYMADTHIFWPTSFFILTIASSIPPLVNPVFRRTALGFLLPKLSAFILTIASVFLVSIIYFDYKLRSRIKIKTQLRNLPLLFIQWYLLPIISFVLSSLPALDAHTKMLLGKKLTYKVTEKS